MAITIITKNTASAGVAPSAGQLVQGELAVNVTDKRLYTLNASNQVVLISSGSDYVVPVTIIVSSASPAVTVTQTGTGGAAVFNNSGSGNAVRITHTGTGSGNALLVEDIANPDSTPFVIDNNGNVVAGYTATVATQNYAGTSVTPKIQLQGTGQDTSSTSVFNWGSATGSPANLILNKSIGGTIGTRGALTVAGTDIGSITFNGDDGTNFIPAAAILAETDGTPGTNDMPGRLVFSTTTDGAATPTERLQISSTGQFTFTVENMVSPSPSAYNFRSTGKVAQTGNYTGLISTVNTDATYTGAGSVIGVYANQGTMTVAPTNAYGFYIPAGWVDATNNYGFYGNIPAGTNRWNFYANGTADNYFAGKVGIGINTPTNALEVSIDQAAPTSLLVSNGLTDSSAYSTITAESDSSAVILNVNSSLGVGSGLIGGASNASLYTTSGTSNGLSVGTVSGPLKFFAGSSSIERFRITSTGALAIAGAANYGTAGQAFISAGNAAPAWTDQFLSITYIFSNITAGDQGDLTIPFACTITEWTLLADVSGSAVIDIWEDTYANYPPVAGDSLVGAGTKPSFSAAIKGRSAPSGWTTTDIVAGSTLRFNVDSASTVNRVTLSLKVKRT